MRYLFSNGQILEWGILGDYLIRTYGIGRYLIMYLLCGIVFIAVISYLLGSINPAILISKKRYGQDVRTLGSGNAGMTNMFRSFGKSAGFLTLAGDSAKALVAVLAGFLILGTPGQYVAGFFCLLGHAFPVYFRFKGGKGVIVSAITILSIDPLVFLTLIVIFALMFAATQIISASSLTAAFFFPLAVYAFNIDHPRTTYILFSLLTSFLVIGMHRENIHRLINKTEKKFVIKKKKEK